MYAALARYYDSEHHDQDDDLNMYAALVAELGAPTLVIGSGTGRAAFHLAQRGARVHGIEIEPEMMRRAEAKRESVPVLRDRVTLHAGDALTLPLDLRFKTVLIPYNTLMHVHQQDEQLALLARCRTWLEDDGALIIDLPNPADSFAAQDTGAQTYERTFTDRETGDRVMQYSISELDRTEQMMQVTWIYDAIAPDGTVRRTVIPARIRYFFMAELRLLLRASGLVVEHVYGDFEGGDFADGCPRMVVVAARG